jgi:transcriptional regulator with XRE-family HTH domain
MMTQDATALETMVTTLGDQIKELRTAAGLSQTQLADIIGARQPIISRIEKGMHVPTLSNLFRIAEALNVELNVLLTLPTRASSK